MTTIIKKKTKKKPIKKKPRVTKKPALTEEEIQKAIQSQLEELLERATAIPLSIKTLLSDKIQANLQSMEWEPRGVAQEYPCFVRQVFSMDLEDGDWTFMVEVASKYSDEPSELLSFLEFIKDYVPSSPNVYHQLHS